MRRFLNEVPFSPDRVLEDIGGISRFHRIQGSVELVDAVLFVKERLEELGIEAILLEDTYDGKKWHLTLQSPIAWELHGGSLKFGEKILTTDESPLLVMAHSPPGEASGEVLPILRDEDWERAEGKVVLLGKDWRDAYRKAIDAGARGFIAYRSGSGRAFPYIGLFLTREEAKSSSLPAVAIPEETAKELERRALSGGVKAEIHVESEIKERERLPMLLARVGEPPYLLFTAHICHPKPGANDNASGSAMLIELSRALEEAWRPDFRLGFAFLWIPEYHGTQAFIQNHGIEDYYASINLDMVAGSPDRSGSTLMFVRTPLSRFSIVSGIVELFLEKTNVSDSSLSGSPLPHIAFRAYPYEMGSDHDVMNFFGVPAVMPITWPDRFYHSSEDTLEKVSRETIGVIGKAVLAGALALAQAGRDELERLARGYSMKLLGEITMERGSEYSKELVELGLHRDSKYLGINVGREAERSGWLEWRLKGILNERLLRARKANWEKFKRLTEDRDVYTQLYELLMLSELLPKEKAFKTLEEEYGKVEKEKLEELVKVLEEGDVVRINS